MKQKISTSIRKTNEKNLTAEQLTQTLAYAGFILVAFELVKSMIVSPIRAFYQDITFCEGVPFKSFNEDVSFRHKNQFEACLLYLRDFMKVIDSKDISTIQSLRKHRNEIAHNLPQTLKILEIKENLNLLEETDKVLFKLSNYRTYMEIGADPDFQNLGIEWDTIKGPEYILFEEIINNLKLMKST